MNNSVTDPIPGFYERHPYPPPVADIHTDVEAWRDGTRRRVEHFRMWPTEAFRDDMEILVAGCGTSQAVRYATRYPNARVTGIDVSWTSIEASRRLAAGYGADNLELHQLPIERIDELGQKFDQIVCTGVLHHLADPSVGLRALREGLTASGALRLMVYAHYGRLGVSLMQEYCRRLGVTPEQEGIDDLVASLRELPLGHPIGHLLRDTPDFHDDLAIADALLNPRERSYTVPQLFDELDGAGLRFARWLRQAPYRPQCGSVSEVPHGVRIAEMADRDQFAAMELFRGTMRRHSVIAHRDDTVLAETTSGAGPGWAAVIPMLAPTVVIVDERLPPGVAGAVINQAHAERDIVLFVDETQRAVIDAIDGQRPMGDIVGATPELLELLWRHDTIVTDQTLVAN